MLKIAVIGGHETVMGFKALGLDAFPVSDGAEAKKILRSVTREGSDYAIIYLEDSFAEALKTEIDRFKDRPSPAIILIPGREGSMGLGLAALNAAVERAVGTNIL